MGGEGRGFLSPFSAFIAIPAQITDELLTRIGHGLGDVGQDFQWVTEG